VDLHRVQGRILVVSDETYDFATIANFLNIQYPQTSQKYSAAGSFPKNVTTTQKAL
jgi:hypothetical protein